MWSRRSIAAVLFLVLILVLFYILQPGLDGSKPTFQQLFPGAHLILLIFFLVRACCLFLHLQLFSEPEAPSSSLLTVKIAATAGASFTCAPQAEKSLVEAADPQNEQQSVGNSSCQYVVWLNGCGLGNKIITLVATFLYALLTNRVLLVDSTTNVHQIFCEPFPQSSWIFPKRFSNLLNIKEDSPSRFGHIISSQNPAGQCLDTNVTGVKLPKIAYANLGHTYGADDMKFFCKIQQQWLQRQVPWLLSRSNIYFVPALYLVPSFRAELERMFPQQEAVFHHLVNYLIHPSNPIWGMTTSFYDSYLAKKEVVAGIQIRILPHLQLTHKNFTSKIFHCAVQNNVLPSITNAATTRSRGCKRSVAVVVTSLDQNHADVLRDMYLRHPTEDGSCVTIHVPSHESSQKTEALEHDEKALMEMYLLSLSDVLVTSPGSTFGYVAQGVAGLRAWQMKSERPLHGDQAAVESYCLRLDSAEPCFHAPAAYICNCQQRKDPKTVLSNVESCEDVPAGIKLTTGLKGNTSS